jgi:hypothetical protein
MLYIHRGEFRDGEDISLFSVRFVYENMQPMIQDVSSASLTAFSSYPESKDPDFHFYPIKILTRKNPFFRDDSVYNRIRSTFMKKSLLILFALPFMSGVIYLFAADGGQEKKFSGRIIYLDNDIFTVKYDSTEYDFSKDTGFKAQWDNAEKNTSAPTEQLEICQYVNVTYRVASGKRIAVRVMILKESDCYQLKK